jgi:hypothetical protein
MLRVSPRGRPDIENLTACLSMVPGTGPAGALSVRAMGMMPKWRVAVKKALVKNSGQKRKE